MRHLIAAVGKLKQGPERELFAHYVGRANATVRKIGLTPLSVIEVAEAKSATAQVRMETEAKALLAKLPSSHKLICLDRGGDQFRSEDFAQTLAKFRDGGAQGLAFLVGGADGLGLTAVFKADRVLSLYPLTHMGSPASFWPSRSTGPGPFSWVIPITAANSSRVKHW
jgi:23S rRNA (pseudouridine1915-N3)-methyltransferase